MDPDPGLAVAEALLARTRALQSVARGGAPVALAPNAFKEREGTVEYVPPAATTNQLFVAPEVGRMEAGPDADYQLYEQAMCLRASVEGEDRLVTRTLGGPPPESEEQRAAAWLAWLEDEKKAVPPPDPAAYPGLVKTRFVLDNLTRRDPSGRAVPPEGLQCIVEALLRDSPVLAERERRKNQPSFYARNPRLVLVGGIVLAVLALAATAFFVFGRREGGGSFATPSTAKRDVTNTPLAPPPLEVAATAGAKEGLEIRASSVTGGKEPPEPRRDGEDEDVIRLGPEYDDVTRLQLRVQTAATEQRDGMVRLWPASVWDIPRDDPGFGTVVERELPGDRHWRVVGGDASAPADVRQVLSLERPAAKPGEGPSGFTLELANAKAPLRDLRTSAAARGIALYAPVGASPDEVVLALVRFPSKRTIEVRLRVPAKEGSSRDAPPADVPARPAPADPGTRPGAAPASPTPDPSTGAIATPGAAPAPPSAMTDPSGAMTDGPAAGTDATSTAPAEASLPKDGRIELREAVLRYTADGAGAASPRWKEVPLFSGAAGPVLLDRSALQARRFEIRVTMAAGAYLAPDFQDHDVVRLWPLMWRTDTPGSSVGAVGSPRPWETLLFQSKGGAGTFFRTVGEAENTPFGLEVRAEKGAVTPFEAKLDLGDKTLLQVLEEWRSGSRTLFHAYGKESFDKTALGTSMPPDVLLAMVIIPDADRRRQDVILPTSVFKNELKLPLVVPTIPRPPAPVLPPVASPAPVGPPEPSPVPVPKTPAPPVADPPRPRPTALTAGVFLKDPGTGAKRRIAVLDLSREMPQLGRVVLRSDEESQRLILEIAASTETTEGDVFVWPRKFWMPEVGIFSEGLEGELLPPQATPAYVFSWSPNGPFAPEAPAPWTLRVPTKRARPANGTWVLAFAPGGAPTTPEAYFRGVRDSTLLMRHSDGPKDDPHYVCGGIVLRVADRWARLDIVVPDRRAGSATPVEPTGGGTK